MPGRKGFHRPRRPLKKLRTRRSRSPRRYFSARFLAHVRRLQHMNGIDHCCLPARFRVSAPGSAGSAGSPAARSQQPAAWFGLAKTLSPRVAPLHLASAPQEHSGYHSRDQVVQGAARKGSPRAAGTGTQDPRAEPCSRMDLRFGGAGDKLRDRPVKIEKPERHSARIRLHARRLFQLMTPFPVRRACTFFRMRWNTGASGT